MEVYYNGRWGAVYDDGWDEHDSKIVCRQLGFESAISHYFGRRRGADILLENIMCSSNDTVLASCGHFGVGIKLIHDSLYSVYKVPGVRCQGAYICKIYD